MSRLAPYFRGFDRHNFSVIAVVILVKSLADDFAFAHEHAANRRIGTGETYPHAREVERVVHEANVV